MINTVLASNNDATPGWDLLTLVVILAFYAFVVWLSSR